MFVGDFMNVKAKVPESWFAAQKQKAYHAPQLELHQILDMYEGDFEAFFMNKWRKAKKGYKQNALRELKNDFRYIKVTVIKQAFQENNYLYIPTRRALQRMEPGTKATDTTKESNNSCSLSVLQEKKPAK
jgi:hypothetical protein